PVARALSESSRRLQGASDADVAWRLVEGVELPPGVKLAVHVVTHDGRPALAAPRTATLVGSSTPLAQLLASRREPVSRTELADDVRDGLGAEALGQLDTLGLALAAPLFRGDVLCGWMALGGSDAQRVVSGNVAA